MVIAATEDSPTTLMSSNMKDEWVLDTGASDHICNNLALFADHHPVYGVLVRQANGRVDAVAIGSVHLNWTRPDGSVRLIAMTNVLFVPDLFTSLVSIRKLHSKGIFFNTGNDIIYRMSDNRLYRDNQSALVAKVTHCSDFPYRPSRGISVANCETAP